MKIILPAFIFVTLATMAPAFAGEPVRPRAEINSMLGTDRSLATTGFWIPIAQDPVMGTVLYTDIRFMGDDRDNREFNAGIGYRAFVPAWDGVAGAHVWLDRRRTDNENNFSQITIGGEWLGNQWDLRANAYIPVSDAQTFESPNTSASTGFVGNQILVSTSQVLEEKALHGLDLELGWRVPFADDVTDNTRIYAGGYHFNASGVEDVTGWRVRTTSDITNYMQVGARFQHDDVRGAQGFLEATIRFPLTAKQSYREHGVRSRLDERAERDVDIISNDRVIDSGMNTPLVNATTGQAQNIIHVDNTAAGGGNGSAETPFNTLAAASVASAENDIIYIHSGTGTALNQNAGITLNKNGVSLMGAGSALTFDGSRFTTANGRAPSALTIIPKSTVRPIISNPAGVGITVAADNLFVSGIAVDGTNQAGIGGSNIQNLIIDNVHVSNSAARAGIELIYNGVDTYDATIRDSRFTGHVLHGIDIRGNGNAVTNLTITDNYMADNGNDGLFLFNQGASRMNGQIQTNNFYNNTRDGFRATARDTSVMDFDLTENQASENNQSGFNLRGEDGSVDATMIDNQAFDNGQMGVFVRLLSGNLTGMFQGNSFTGNGQNGIRFDDDHANQMIVDMGGGALGSTGQNQIFGNTQADVRVDMDGDTLAARMNWWGNAAGPQVGDTQLEDGSGIDTTGFLTSAP